MTARAQRGAERGRRLRLGRGCGRRRRGGWCVNRRLLERRVRLDSRSDRQDGLVGTPVDDRRRRHRLGRRHRRRRRHRGGHRIDILGRGRRRRGRRGRGDRGGGTRQRRLKLPGHVGEDRGIDGPALGRDREARCLPCRLVHGGRRIGGPLRGRPGTRIDQRRRGPAQGPARSARLAGRCRGDLRLGRGYEGRQGRRDVLTGLVAAEQHGIERQAHGRASPGARDGRRHDHRHLEPRIEQGSVRRPAVSGRARGGSGRRPPWTRGSGSGSSRGSARYRS